MPHSIADGNGIDELTRILMQLVRNAEDGSTNEESSPRRNEATWLGQDRSILRDMKRDIAFDIADHAAYRYKTTSTSLEETPESPGQHPFQATMPEIPILLHITDSSVARLKADATTPGARISTHDALSAPIWRSGMLIRSHHRRLPASSTLLSSSCSPTRAVICSFLPRTSTIPCISSPSRWT